MNSKVEIICDRCGKTVHGIIIDAENGLPKITGGFYDVTGKDGWAEYRRNDTEQNVCDRCMWQDPKFIEKYPVERKIPKV